jgi:mannose-1-phosphate guanylyltransferase
MPVLGIWLELCKRYGINEVLVNVHSHSDLIEDYLRNNRNGVHVQLSNEAVLLGSAGTLLRNREWVNGESCFWILYADVLTTANLGQMLQLHQSRNPAATLGLYQVPDPTRCGVVRFDESYVVREFVEKPAVPVSRWAFAGFMIGTPQLLDVIPSSQPADLGFDVLPRLVGQMLACPIPEYVLDIGTIQNYQTAQRSWPGLPEGGEEFYATSDHL